MFTHWLTQLGPYFRKLFLADFQEGTHATSGRRIEAHVPCSPFLFSFFFSSCSRCGFYPVLCSRITFFFVLLFPPKKTRKYRQSEKLYLRSKKNTLAEYTTTYAYNTHTRTWSLRFCSISLALHIAYTVHRTFRYFTSIAAQLLLTWRKFCSLSSESYSCCIYRCYHIKYSYGVGATQST